MKKIPTLFKRNFDTNHQVRDQVTPGCEWVLDNEGAASKKYDGTCCLVKEKKLFKRYELKKGNSAPEGFVAAQEPDLETGDQPGWVPCAEENPADYYHWEAWDTANYDLPDGTYELCGPKVQKNPEGLSSHFLIPHGREVFVDCPRSFEGLRDYLDRHNIEGIVFKHPDGRMAKIKKKDYGMRR